MNPYGVILIEFGVLTLILIPTLIAAVKGAPWIPTPMERVRHMLKAANIKPGEKVYDLGCGDGRLVHYAAHDYSAQAIGFELSPLVFLVAKIRQALWRSKAEILFRDFRKVDLSDADVVLCYLLPRSLNTFQKKFENELRNGTRVISYAFRIGDWESVQTLERIPEKNLGTVWIYEIGLHHLTKKSNQHQNQPQ